MTFWMRAWVFFNVIFTGFISLMVLSSTGTVEMFPVIRVIIGFGVVTFLFFGGVSWLFKGVWK